MRMCGAKSIELELGGSVLSPFATLPCPWEILVQYVLLTFTSMVLEMFRIHL